MIEISSKSVKDLREKTGAGIMDCKKALLETSGNIEEAIDWLRKKGLAAASKKSGRVASEGLVGVASNETKAVLVEVNAETDFVGRNAEFQKFVQTTCEIVLRQGEGDALLLPYPNRGTIQDELNRLISIIGENLQFRRTLTIQVNQGVVSTYMHSAVAPGLGKIGVIVGLESSASKEILLDLGKKLAMHIAASNPLAISIQDVDPLLLERERNILLEQAQASNRPDDVIAKMVDGRIKKFYEEVVLLEQPYVFDPKTKVKDILMSIGGECKILISGMAKFTLGEGIEKRD